MAERVKALPSAVMIHWMPESGRPSISTHAHDATILPSGWLRVTWLDGTTSHVSPVAVREVSGKGVSYGA